MRPKATTVAALGIACAAASLASSAEAQDTPQVQEIVERHLEAAGGRAELEAIRTRAMSGEIFIAAANLVGEFEYLAAPPNMISTVDLSAVGARAQNGVTDGVAWVVDPMMGPSIVSGADAFGMRLQAELEPFLDWEASFESAEVGGLVDVEATETRQVDFHTPEGPVVEAYFATDSGLLRRLAIVDGARRTLVTFDDYRPVGDLVLAHSMTSVAPEGAVEITLDSIEDNVEIPAERLAPPPEIEALQENN